MTDHAILFPEPQTVWLGKKPVRITPVQFCDFDRFGAAAAAVLQLLGSGTAVPALAELSRRSGDLRTILRSCTSLSRWRIDRLPAPVAVQLMLAVIRANSDFFAQALTTTAALAE
jgi:hypothetical protein